MRLAAVLALAILTLGARVTTALAGAPHSLTVNAGPPAPVPPQPVVPRSSIFPAPYSIFPAPHSIFTPPSSALGVPSPTRPLDVPPVLYFGPPYVYGVPYVALPSCASTGYWTYVWVPGADAYPPWVPGHFSDDGFWIDGRYEAPVVTSGSWQPFWVETPPGC